MTGTEEKYARAVRSSHLSLTHQPGDVDALIAAGLLSDGLGVDLMRLRAEYDTVAGLPGARKAMPLLKRMAPTRKRLVAFAVRLATARCVSMTTQDVEATTVRVLDLFLDPTCGLCRGTGLVGEFGGVRTTCKACHGAKVRMVMWESEEQDRFANALQMRMVEKIESAQLRIQRLLRIN